MSAMNREQDRQATTDSDEEKENIFHFASIIYGQRQTKVM